MCPVKSTSGDGRTIDPRHHEFGSLVGHELAIRYLDRAVASETLPHAVLIHGPRGVGKTSLAFALVKRVIRYDSGEGDLAADLVRKVSDGVSSQVVLVEPKGPADQLTLRGWKLGGDDPDNAQYYRFVETRPLEGSRKFVIIRRSERMNVALSNYLLKLIEEPPPYLGIVLLSERPGELLNTIRSRCAPVCLGPLPDDTMGEFLAFAAGGASKGDQELLLRLAGGSPGRLLELANGDDSGLVRELPRLMGIFKAHGFLALFRTASDLLLTAEQGGRGGDSEASAFEAVLDGLLAWFRDALLVKTLGSAAAAPLLAHPNHARAIEEWSGALSLEALMTGVEGTLGAYAHVPRRSDKNYVLESLLMRFGRAMRV